MITATALLLLFVLLAIGVPIAFCMLITGAFGLYLIGGTTAVFAIVAGMPHEKAASYEFLAIPMFLLMAQMVLKSGIADDLFAAASAWMGRMPGGLGVATAFAGAGFGAICGSSTAAAATLSSTSLPAMLRYGYDQRMASGVVAISGTLSMLIPPSIAMVVYAMLTDVSVAKMLIAGVIPGLIVTLTIAATVIALALHDPSSAPLSEKVPLREKVLLLRRVGPMLVLLSLVTGSIYLGVATPTEASGLGALCATVMYLVRVRPGLVEFGTVFAHATRGACMIGMIVLGAHVFSTFMALTQSTQMLTAWIGGLAVEPWMIIVCLVVIYLLLGCVMDQLAILVLTVPIVAQLVSSLGYDLIWFGVIFIVTAELGMVTPPMGLNCFVVSKYSETPLREVFMGIVPHFVAHLGAIAILLAFPALTLWLPSQM